MSLVLQVSGSWGSDVRVVIAGLTNTYSSYITTIEEYGVQRYEGASTIFGPHTLDAYIQVRPRPAVLLDFLQYSLWQFLSCLVYFLVVGTSKQHMFERLANILDHGSLLDLGGFCHGQSAEVYCNDTLYKSCVANNGAPLL